MPEIARRVKTGGTKTNDQLLLIFTTAGLKTGKSHSCR